MHALSEVLQNFRFVLIVKADVGKSGTASCRKDLF